MASKNNPLSRKDNLVVQELNGEVLIYDLKENKAFCLNETSALIWEACDGNKSVGEISKEISKKLNSPANEDFVWLALDQLKKENLLANGEEVAPSFNGLSRREVIKRVGLGTMIALPIVTGLVAPQAIHAQSGLLPIGTNCTVNSQCADGCCSTSTLLNGQPTCQTIAAGNCAATPTPTPTPTPLLPLNAVCTTSSQCADGCCSTSTLDNGQPTCQVTSAGNCV